MQIPLAWTFIKINFLFAFKILRKYFYITFVIRLLNNHFIFSFFNNNIKFSENILESY